MSDPNSSKGGGFTMLNFFKSKTPTNPNTQESNSSQKSSQPKKTNSVKRKAPLLTADIFNDENEQPNNTQDQLITKKLKLNNSTSIVVEPSFSVGDVCVLNADVDESGNVKNHAVCHLILSIDKNNNVCRLGDLLKKTQTDMSLSDIARSLDIDQLVNLDYNSNKSFELAISLLKLSVHSRINFEFSNKDSIQAIITDVGRQEIFSDDSDVISKKKNKKPKKTFKIKNFFFDAEKFTQPVEIAQFNQTNFSNKNFSEGELQNIANGAPSHHKYDFLKEQNIKDKNGVPFSDPSSDKSTLFVPQSFLNGKDITPAMRQWWKFKSEHYDTVLFFKLGKFYETYHMDADIAVKECGLVYMRGGHAHAGFPETSFAHYCSMLVDRGYKVARVEQTETPAMLNERVKTQKVGSKDKVISRELVSITTPGTRMFDPFDIDGSCSSGSQKSRNGLLAAVYFDSAENEGNLLSCKIGICILNSATGNYYLSQFEDHVNHLINLKTLVSSFPEPILELVVSKQLTISQSYIYSHVKQVFPAARIELVAKNFDKFYRSSQSYSNYIDNERVVNFLKSHFGSDCFVDIEKIESAICLAYTVNYLVKNLVDHKINFYKKITYTYPPTLNKATTQIVNEQPTFLVLDFAALSTLDIIDENTGLLEDNMTDKTTILSIIDHCGSPFGSRRMLHLLSHPLFDKEKLILRQKQIDQLISIDSTNELSILHDEFKSMPDLEKLLFRVHSFSIYKIEQYKKHPEYRAVMFNQEKFSKKKIADLQSCVKGFQMAVEVVDKVLENEKLNSFHGDFFGFENSDLNAVLDAFTETFDLQASSKTGLIVFKSSSNAQFAEIDKEIAEIQGYFDQKLVKFVKKYKLKKESTKYLTSGKLRYLVEVSSEDSKKLSQQKFTYTSHRKGFVRYTYTNFDKKIEALKELEDKKNKMMADSLYWVMGEFSKNHALLQNVIDKLALLDCLVCLAKFSLNSYHTGKMCRPQFAFDSDSQFLDIVGGYHPILACKSDLQGEVKTVVANDTQLGRQQNLMLVTGPNMGGKSTLLRQVAIITILAQMGCYVPAERCELTPVDRIFVRLGAAFDRPDQNQSTFYVEMCETSYIMKYSTGKSLVLIDELGRGTATHDGTAIAGAVLDSLVGRKEEGYVDKPLVMFSTHYHSLVQKYVFGGRNVKFGYMGYMEENTKEGDITFMYKLIEGVCDKSFGFSVAKMAGLESEVIESARATAELFYKRGLLINMLRSVFVGDREGLEELLVDLAGK